MPPGNPNDLVVKLMLSQAISPEEVSRHAYMPDVGQHPKPWPFYRDPQTSEWFRLSPDCEVAAEARPEEYAWVIDDLPQLARQRPRSEWREHFAEALARCEAAARALGGRIEPDFTPESAVDRTIAAIELKQILEASVLLLVRRPDGVAPTVDEWWHAFEEAGLEVGDGDMFYRFEERIDEDGQRWPDEVFMVEPHSVGGYFHRGDLGSGLTFPDMRFSFRLRGREQPQDDLSSMLTTARRVAAAVGGTVLDDLERDLDEAKLRNEVATAVQRIAELQPG